MNRAPPANGLRRHAAGTAALAAVALLLLWLLLRPSAEPAGAVPPPPPSEREAPRAIAAPPQSTPPLDAPAARTAPGTVEGEPPPVIDEVSVEKPEVCEGEENLVTVRAHTVNGSDPWLHFTVGAKTGARVPVRAWLDGDREPPRVTVSAFGRGNVATVVEAPYYRVKRCPPSRGLAVVPNLRVNTLDAFDFEAKVLQQGAREERTRPFHARSWTWDFGDGSAAVTTDGPRASHGYGDRPQRTLYSQFMVRVEATGDGGETLVGRASLQLLNPAFEAREKGAIAILVELTPRLPEMGADGVVRQGVRLYHAESGPVFVDRVWVMTHRMGGEGDPAPERMDPHDLLGGRRIPPGRGLTAEVKLDTRARPDLFSVDYVLEGESESGAPARGTFSVMRPAQRPTRESHQPVIDPMLKAKILAARRILGQEYVTDEDIWRLEREGRFADLEVEPPRAPVIPPTPPVAAPDPGLPPPGPRAVPGADPNPKPARAPRKESRPPG